MGWRWEGPKDTQTWRVVGCNRPPSLHVVLPTAHHPNSAHSPQGAPLGRGHVLHGLSLLARLEVFRPGPSAITGPQRPTTGRGVAGIGAMHTALAPYAGCDFDFETTHHHMITTHKPPPPTRLFTTLALVQWQGISRWESGACSGSGFCGKLCAGARDG
jgi:hypothetical protein